ncbi:MAG: hypothetical protein GXO15_06140 [Crenarchaeota archaeon]|nr:hypothetical protein [Thermoproteota archaeon]
MAAPLYRETTDYVWALTRQIDRVAEAASSIDAAGVKRGARLGLLGYAIALRQLYTMVKPVLQQTEIPDHMAKLEKTIGDIMRADAERLAEIGRKLDRIQMELIQALHVECLLIRGVPQLT